MERLTERKYGEIVSSKREKTQIHCSHFCNNCSKGTGDCGYIREMVQKLADYEDKEEQGGWIPVSERLPDVGAEVLVFTEGYDEVGIAWRYDDEGWRSNEFPFGFSKYVVAWMPLPEQYKGE